MVDTATPVCDFGRPAPDFSLPGIDGKTYDFASIAGPNGTLLMFICNHCPFVQAVASRIVRDVAALSDHGIGAAAIMSNDIAAYPDDSPENMKLFAAKHGFGFPYLVDESQEVAKAYGAVCTPDFFGFNAARALQYRGRLDSSGRQPAPVDARRELFEAMAMVAKTGAGPREQVPSIGCSIKWKDA